MKRKYQLERNIVAIECYLHYCKEFAQKISASEINKEKEAIYIAILEKEAQHIFGLTLLAIENIISSKNIIDDVITSLL